MKYCARAAWCDALATEAHYPWCSEECQKIGRAVNALVADKGERSHPSPPAELAARFAWPWLDVRVKAAS